MQLERLHANCGRTADCAWAVVSTLALWCAAWPVAAAREERALFRSYWAHQRSAALAAAGRATRALVRAVAAESARIPHAEGGKSQPVDVDSPTGTSPSLRQVRGASNKLRPRCRSLPRHPCAKARVV